MTIPNDDLPGVLLPVTPFDLGDDVRALSVHIDGGCVGFGLPVSAARSREADDLDRYLSSAQAEAKAARRPVSTTLYWPGSDRPMRMCRAVAPALRKRSSGQFKWALESHLGPRVLIARSGMRTRVHVELSARRCITVGLAAAIREAKAFVAGHLVPLMDDVDYAELDCWMSRLDFAVDVVGWEVHRDDIDRLVSRRGGREAYVVDTATIEYAQKEWQGFALGRGNLRTVIYRRMADHHKTPRWVREYYSACGYDPATDGPITRIEFQLRRGYFAGRDARERDGKPLPTDPEELAATCLTDLWRSAASSVRLRAAGGTDTVSWWTALQSLEPGGPAGAALTIRARPQKPPAAAVELSAAQLVELDVAVAALGRYAALAGEGDLDAVLRAVERHARCVPPAAGSAPRRRTDRQRFSPRSWVRSIKDQLSRAAARCRPGRPNL